MNKEIINQDGTKGIAVTLLNDSDLPRTESGEVADLIHRQPTAADIAEFEQKMRNELQLRLQHSTYAEKSGVSGSYDMAVYPGTYFLPDFTESYRKLMEMHEGVGFKPQEFNGFKGFWMNTPYEYMSHVHLRDAMFPPNRELMVSRAVRNGPKGTLKTTDGQELDFKDINFLQTILMGDHDGNVARPKKITKRQKSLRKYKTAMNNLIFRGVNRKA